MTKNDLLNLMADTIGDLLKEHGLFNPEMTMRADSATDHLGTEGKDAGEEPADSVSHVVFEHLVVRPAEGQTWESVTKNALIKREIKGWREDRHYIPYFPAPIKQEDIEKHLSIEDVSKFPENMSMGCKVAEAPCSLCEESKKDKE